MKDSLKTRLFQYLKAHPNQWLNGGILERYAEELGYKGSNGGRRARELVGPKVERREVLTKEGRRTVEYRYVESPYELMKKAVERGEQPTLALI